MVRAGIGGGWRTPSAARGAAGAPLLPSRTSGRSSDDGGEQQVGFDFVDQMRFGHQVLESDGKGKRRTQMRSSTDWRS